jgi:hypothetical protein
LGQKGSKGMGGVGLFGVLRCAQDDGKDNNRMILGLGSVCLAGGGDLRQKGSKGMGGVGFFGVLRCAQDDSKGEWVHLVTAICDGNM